MECKCIYAFKVSFCDAELIDTLWNVNEGSSAALVGAEKELIDTLWNVNPPFCLSRC